MKVEEEEEDGERSPKKLSFFYVVATNERDRP